MALADYKASDYDKIKRFTVQEWLIKLEHRIQENEKAGQQNVSEDE